MSPRLRVIRLTIAVTVVACAAGARAAEPSAPVIDFNKDIKPLFEATCLTCHGPEKAKGDLRLDARPLALAGGVSGPLFEAGKGEQSLLVRRLRGHGGEDRMPLKKEPLSDQQIAKVVAWIDQGGHWPAAEGDERVEVKKHWAFVKPVRPAEPAVANEAWVRNPIDRFILARLEREGIKPSPEAPRETLLRRVHLDLTGLPPTPAEGDAFLLDNRPDAYERVVDRLLASKHYGERWGRHWLDGARYADSNGYSIDAPRSIWPYRDWVIGALNDDMPFDRFALEQLAGDLLPDATTAQRVATGFHRNTQINEEGGIDPEQFRVESVVDRVGTTGTVFLGLTVACAQCHNHKFDPISHKEYYRLFAFFNNADEPKLKVGDHPEAERLRERIGKLESAADAQGRREAAQLKRQLAEGVSTLVIKERAEPRATHVLIKGDFTRPSEAVTPGVPRVLHPLETSDGATPTRLDLAWWVGSPENPLTARVAVNRMWQQYFGRGLVETDNDFGTQGTLPSHPELLDWLATEFMRRGWGMKAMHRLIVTSATYRQSSHARPDLAEIDPQNRLLARQSRLRLEAEIVRDVMLTASGLLCDTVGGPGVYPPQPEGVLGLGQVKRVWTESTGPDRYRRGMYTFIWRMTPHPLLGVFDAPEATSACTRRARSNTPLQSLTLLNDKAFVEFAQALGARAMEAGGGDDAERAAHLFRLCTGRRPSADEVRVLLVVLRDERAAFAARPEEAKQIVNGSPMPVEDAAGHAAWTMVARVVLNLDETITRE